MKNVFFIMRLIPFALFTGSLSLFAAQDSTVSLVKPVDNISPAASTPPPPAKTVDNMRQEAAKLRAEAKALRELSDTLSKSSDDAENKAHEVAEKADDITNEMTESEAHKVARLVNLEMQRIKRVIQADVERIKKLHGNATANDSLYVVQADSLDSLVAHIPKDTLNDMTKQKVLLDEIHSNSKALLAKSREMSLKARELEESADKRDDIAEELSEKADKLAEEQNTLALSRRFPLHVGFQIRITEIGSLYAQRADFLLLHGMNITYSPVQYFEAGIQDISFYWQQTMYGSRFAITASPVIKGSFFLVKRLQVGCALGATFENRFGANQEPRLSTVPFVALFNEIWVRNHFSISPILRYNYAMYGPAYTLALSQHSGVLPQKASWLDFGIGYNFNF